MSPVQKNIWLCKTCWMTELLLCWTLCLELAQSVCKSDLWVGWGIAGHGPGPETLYPSYRLNLPPLIRNCSNTTTTKKCCPSRASHCISLHGPASNYNKSSGKFHKNSPGLQRYRFFTFFHFDCSCVSPTPPHPLCCRRLYLAHDRLHLPWCPATEMALKCH